MYFPFFDTPLREPSQFVGFAGNRIDRQSERRPDHCVFDALTDPSARIMVLGNGRVLLRPHGEAFDPWFSVAECGQLGFDVAGAILLGTADHGPALALSAALDPEKPLAGLEILEHRTVYIQGLIGEPELGALAQASSLLTWNHTHGFCGRCGQKTDMRAGGYRRNCPACGTDHFPRTDPVAIMLTVTEEKCLMGRGRHFAPGSYSALAGFIEPGETFEDAVRRETFEEAGIRLGRVVYHASQPWPFPHSLMIGCYGEPLNDEINMDLNELEDCRWFSRNEVRLMLARTHPQQLVVPPQGAIAHHLIRAWAENTP
ncbi:NAD(+) diphosphatase [Aquamicrobium segne]|uniref:NAD(+) diphosphatase n=1 Tax=Aquamicrobium segne TaxID=469547 RepID=A0ABW0H488_9HYPH